MQGRYVRLKDNWFLRGWSDVEWALVNNEGEFYKLGENGFYVASACNGNIDFNSNVFSSLHQSILNRLLEYGIAEECGKGRSIPKIQHYHRADNPCIMGIQWAVTGRCNMHCRHCYMNAPSGKVAELDYKDIVRLIDQFQAANVMAVSLTGGEPFVRDDIMDIIRLITKKRIRLMDIYSNGTLIDDNILASLKMLEVFPVFRISFDGCGTHDNIRGSSGMEEHVIETIRRIRRYGFEVAVTTSVQRVNIDKLIDTYELMSTLDIQAWGVGRPQPVGCWKNTAEGVSLDEMAKEALILKQHWLDDGCPFVIGIEAFYSGAPQTPEAAYKPLDKEAYTCNSCRQWPYLASDGCLLPCIAYEEVKETDRFPNLLTTCLSDAWKDSYLRSLMDIRIKDVLSHNKDCMECSILSVCKTGCRASALLDTGDIMAKDNLTCTLLKGGYKERFKAAEVHK